MLKENEIREILSEILETEQNINQIALNDDLRIYNLDSLKAIELIVMIEEKYSISISEDDLFIDNVTSIEKIINIIYKYQNDKLS